MNYQILYTLAKHLEDIPTHRSKRIYYGFNNLEDALTHKGVYGDHLFEVKAKLNPKDQDGYAYSSGTGDAPEYGQGWGVNSSGWVSYPSRFVREARLVNS
jgi:hypothetical protein